MNNNMTDILEQYIKSLFNEATEDHIIIKRSNVAQKFDCVPSQLNYVIKTRFTPEHGFIIESKRGGGGFIRITKITLHANKDYIDYLIETVENEIVEFFKKNCSLYFERFIEDIEYLKTCRNKCAHLKVNDNSLYVPNDYHAKMMICSMYDHVLSVKAPFIMDLFKLAEKDIEKYTERIIIFDPDGLDETIKRKITDKYLQRMTEGSLRKSYKTFLKLLYNSDDEECIRNILGLYAFVFSMTAYLMEQGHTNILREPAILDEFSKIKVDELENNSIRADILGAMVLKYSIIMEIIRENEEVFEYLKKHVLTPTGLAAYRGFYPQDPRSEYGFFKDTLSLHKNKYIKEIFETVKPCEDFNLAEFVKIMVKAIPRYFGFDDADCYMSFLKNHVEELDISELQEVMDVYNTNDQCYNRGRHTEDMEIIEPYLAKGETPF